MFSQYSFELIRLHLALECTGIDENLQLYRIPCANPDTLHRVYVARHANGDSIFFRSDLAQHIRAKLLRLQVYEYFDFPGRIQAVLEEDSPCQEIHICKSYVFLAAGLAELCRDAVRLSDIDPEVVRRYDPDLDPVSSSAFGILDQGEIVSSCQSSRENEHAGEAWVRTLEGFRRRGYARQVTAAWGLWLMQHDKVPFYSHRWDNMASQALAQSLGLEQYIADAGYA